jgi:type I restriction enzyme S subunit
MQFSRILSLFLHKRHYEKFTDGSVKDIEDEIPFDIPDG